jgi:electron transfer flavoprotein alpha/beta subunit
MKGIVVAGLLLGVVGCIALGVSRGKLIQTASFDHDCPEEKIKVLKEMEDMGTGNYLLDICGKEAKYKRTGSVYYDAKNPPEAVKQAMGSE